MRNTAGISGTFASILAIATLAVLIVWGAMTIETRGNSLVHSGVVLHFAFNTIIVLIALGFALRRHPYSMNLFHLVGLLIFACVAGFYQYLTGAFPLAGPVMGAAHRLA